MAQRGDRRRTPDRKLEGKVQAWSRRVVEGMAQDPQQMLQQAQDVLAWSLRKNGPESPFSIKAMVEVANQLSSQGRAAEEVVLREQVVVALRHTARVDDQATVNAEMHLAVCLVRLERWEEAESLLAHVVARRELTLGPDAPETLVAMAWSATAAKKLGKLHEARIVQTRIVHGYESGGSAESAQATSAAVNLASTLMELGETQEAARLLRRVLEVRQRTLGPDDPGALEVRGYLAALRAGGGPTDPSDESPGAPVFRSEFPDGA
jgi:eukaryotic-like serine/threonine-protein kinase